MSAFGRMKSTVQENEEVTVSKKNRNSINPKNINSNLYFFFSKSSQAESLQSTPRGNHFHF